jgi:hypothetical protein
MAHSPELYELSRVIPKHLIEPPPAGKYGHYVPHFVITQILLATIGPFDWEIVEKLYGEMPPIETKNNSYPGGQGIVGVIMRLTAKVDGQIVVIEEIGAVGSPAKEPTDADRLKKGMSDAMKRCAMRLGVGVHLWCKRDDQVILAKTLRAGADETDEDEPVLAGEDDEN